MSKENAYDGEYLDYLKSQYVKYKFTIDDVTQSAFKNNTSMINTLGVNKENNHYTSMEYSFYQAPIVLEDIYGYSETFDKLLYYFRTGEMFPTVIKFKDITENEELEGDFKAWKRETDKLKNSKGVSEADKVKYAPVKDLRLSFGQYSNAILENCKILDVLDVNTYAITVNRIIFVKS